MRTQVHWLISSLVSAESCLFWTLLTISIHSELSNSQNIIIIGISLRKGCAVGGIHKNQVMFLQKSSWVPKSWKIMHNIIQNGKQWPRYSPLIHNWGLKSTVLQTLEVLVTQDTKGIQDERRKFAIYSFVFKKYKTVYK